VEEDVVLGCHQAAFFIDSALDSKITFRRLADFIQRHARLEEASLTTQENWIGADEPTLLRDMDEERDALPSPSVRWTHSCNWLRLGCIFRLPSARFLNRYHEQLSQKLASMPPAAASSTDGTLPLLPADPTLPRYLLRLSRAESLSISYLTFLILCLTSTVGGAAAAMIYFYGFRS
jgi:hypothetical protein